MANFTIQHSKLQRNLEFQQVIFQQFVDIEEFTSRVTNLNLKGLFMDERSDGFEQLYDGEGITLNTNEVFLFKCCDCGLVQQHRREGDV